MSFAISGYPDVLQSQLFQRTVTKNRVDLATAAQELTTGNTTDVVGKLAGRANEFNLVTKALADIEAGQTRLQLTESRLRVAETALQSIRSRASELADRAETDSLVEGGAGAVQTVATARSSLESVVNRLNESYAGRFLFSGDDVGTPTLASIDDINASFDAAFGGITDSAALETAISDYFGPGGTFETTIYQGGTQNSSAVLLDSGTSIQNQARGDDASLRNVVEGLARLIYQPEDGRLAWISNAVGTLRQGEIGTLNLEADLGRQRQLVAEEIVANQEQESVLRNSREELIGVDAFEAASRVTRLEAQLEASYTIAARISRLTFTDFIR